MLPAVQNHKDMKKHLFAPLAILLLCGMAACSNKETNTKTETPDVTASADSLPVALPPVDATPVNAPKATELPAPVSRSQTAAPSK